MAEVLLNRDTRIRLARVLAGKPCPQDVDQHVYQGYQRGDRLAISIRNLAALTASHGDIVLQAIPGLRR